MLQGSNNLWHSLHAILQGCFSFSSLSLSISLSNPAFSIHNPLVPIPPFQPLAPKPLSQYPSFFPKSSFSFAPSPSLLPHSLASLPPKEKGESAPDLSLWPFYPGFVHLQRTGALSCACPSPSFSPFLSVCLVHSCPLILSLSHTHTLSISHYFSLFVCVSLSIFCVYICIYTYIYICISIPLPPWLLPFSCQ